MEGWLNALWELFKVITPLLTGGLAGATLTYILNQRNSRRKQARILLTTECIDYSVAGKDDHLNGIRVSYRGTEFNNIMLYEINIENVSIKTVPKCPFLLFFERDISVVDWSTLTRPTDRETNWTQQHGHENAYLWDAGELKPGDSARLRLLLAPTTSINWSWRGDDEVEVTSSGREAGQTVERELRNVIFWISLYIFFGTIPFFAGMAHALLLIVSMPYIVSRCIRWWPTVTSRRRDALTVNAGGEANVAVVIGDRGTALAPSRATEALAPPRIVEPITDQKS